MISQQFTLRTLVLIINNFIVEKLPEISSSVQPYNQFKARRDNTIGHNNSLRTRER